MTRRTIQAVVACLLIVLGWAIGRAQMPAPEFTLAIEAPGGRTTVKCVRGCTLQGGQDEDNPNNTPTPKYWFECSGGAQCSATVNGWMKR